MKFVGWDAAAFLEGVIGLNAEERGFYITLISLLYARAPRSDVTDELVIKAMACRPQTWQKTKKSLIAKGKVRETHGKLEANSVQTRVKLAFQKSVSGGEVEQNQGDVRRGLKLNKEKGRVRVRARYARPQPKGKRNGTDRQENGRPRTILEALDRLGSHLSKTDREGDDLCENPIGLLPHERST